MSVLKTRKIDGPMLHREQVAKLTTDPVALKLHFLVWEWTGHHKSPQVSHGEMCFPLLRIAYLAGLHRHKSLVLESHRETEQVAFLLQPWLAVGLRPLLSFSCGKGLRYMKQDKGSSGRSSCQRVEWQDPYCLSGGSAVLWRTCPFPSLQCVRGAKLP